MVSHEVGGGLLNSAGLGMKGVLIDRIRRGIHKEVPREYATAAAGGWRSTQPKATCVWMHQHQRSTHKSNDSLFQFKIGKDNLPVHQSAGA